MIQLASSNSPVEVAWAAFDAAALALHCEYAACGAFGSGVRAVDPDARNRRMLAAQEVVRLWDEWRTLFLASEPFPGDAA